MLSIMNSFLKYFNIYVAKFSQSQKSGLFQLMERNEINVILPWSFWKRKRIKLAFLHVMARVRH